MESASYGRLPLLSPVGSPLSSAFHQGVHMISCAHFWVIESPNGPISAGLCKLCGEMREFRNSMYSSTWSKGTVKRRNGLHAE